MHGRYRTQVSRHAADSGVGGAGPAAIQDAVPEGAAYWTHTLEGADDMPAHLKASLLGPSVTIPVAEGRLALGTWQGIYLCEHRDRGGPRSLVVTAWGDGR